ncbi:MAG: hypothetical protein CALGDGBN_00696 [Pseudomonadales bacterium]|nr:hypothetical protein [Pseudomonadales bacterium]
MRNPTLAVKRALKTGLGVFAAGCGPQTWPFGAPGLWILMYHRVLPREQALAEGEEPGMYVTPQTFARQLDWLGARFTVVRLGEWVERVRSGSPLPRRACAITFDDGWLDNYRHALPALRARGLPATLFAVSDMVGTTRQFWPNRLSRLLDAHGAALAADSEFAWLHELAAPLPGGLTTAIADPDSRSALIHRCKALPDDRLDARLGAAEQALGTGNAAPRALVDWDELRAMVASGLIDVGSHTRNHYRLRDGLTPQTLRDEIVGSRTRLEQELGRPVTLFCYPNGDYTPQAAALVRKHYAAAVTTARGINRGGRDLATLRRIGIHEDMSHTRTRFLVRLSGWV